MKRQTTWVLAVVAALTLLAGCATPGDTGGEAKTRTRPLRTQGRIGEPTPSEMLASAATPGSGKAAVQKGTGIMVKGQEPGGGVPVGPPPPPPQGSIVLNFEGVDIREVVANVLGGILNESYTIDPAVGGQVTIRTSSGISRDALPATLEMLLRMNGATMVKEAGIYKIVPSAAAVRGNTTPQLGSSQRPLPPGFSVQVVPLRYVGVREMLRILEPFAKDAQAIRGDELRNLLILAGTERELRHLIETVDMFDIDWMAGMSAGIFTLQNADVKSVMAEFEKIVGSAQQNPFGGILRIVPIERLNALLVISPQPAYLEQAKVWIERLDRGGGGDGPRLYIFSLQNSRAEKVAPLLQQAFTGRPAAPTQAAPTVTPGTPSGTIVNPPAFTPQSAVVQPTITVQQAPQPAQQTPTTVRAGEGTGIVRNLVAVADRDNNAIVIVATPAEYLVIEQALRRLDVPSRQVVIEVTMAEVTLTDDLQFGVEWLFRDAAPSGRGAGGLVNNPLVPPATSGSSNGVANAISAALSKGFTYLITNGAFPGGIQAALRLLDTYGDTKVISNPHLSAIDNQKATIKVGDRIPICQQTIVGGVTNAVTTTSQYVDTGVLLQVTPHINSGGLVTLDVQAEVSIAGTTANVCDPPPINTRSVQTLVSVPTGQTMVMGGLINEAKGNTSAGLPLISRIPVFGGLFGSQELKNNRTELVIFITPRVVENEFDVRGVIDDLRKRMERLDDVFQQALKPTAAAPTPSPADSGKTAPSR